MTWQTRRSSCERAPHGGGMPNPRAEDFRREGSKAPRICYDDVLLRLSGYEPGFFSQGVNPRKVTTFRLVVAPLSGLYLQERRLRSS